MNNLVDLSSIYGFSSFNNIKQRLREVGLTGGGKKFFLKNKKGLLDKTRPVAGNISERLNGLLESGNLPQDVIKIFGRKIFIRKDGSGTIDGDSFIGIDEPLPVAAAAAASSASSALSESVSAAAVDSLESAKPRVPPMNFFGAPKSMEEPKHGKSLLTATAEPTATVELASSESLVAAPPAAAALPVIVFPLETQTEFKKAFSIPFDRMQIILVAMVSPFESKRLIAVVCIKDVKYKLYFVDPSNQRIIDVLTHDFEITDIVFNPVLVQNKLQFAIIEQINDGYNFVLFNYSYSDSHLTKIINKSLPQNMFRCAIAFLDGKSMITGITYRELVRVSIRGIRDEIIYSSTSIKKVDPVTKIKVSPFGDFIVLMSYREINVYTNKKQIQLHFTYRIDKQDPEFDFYDNSNRTCRLIVVGEFLTKHHQDTPALCIALYTEQPNNCIHLYDVVKKKKFDQLELEMRLDINHMELYSKNYLILSSIEGIYALNTVTRNMVLIIRGCSSSFAIDKHSMYCPSITDYFLEKFDLSPLKKIRQDASVESSSPAAAAAAAVELIPDESLVTTTSAVEHMPDESLVTTTSGVEHVPSLETATVEHAPSESKTEESNSFAHVEAQVDAQQLEAEFRAARLHKSMENPIDRYSSQNERRLSIYKNRDPIPELTDAKINRKFYTDMTYETNDVISVFKNYMINILTYVLNNLEVSYTDCDFKVKVEIDDLSSKIIMSIFCKDETKTNHDLGHLSLFLSNQLYPKGSIHYTNRISGISREDIEDLGVYHLMLNKMGTGLPLIKCKNSDFTQDIPFDDIFRFLTNKINDYPLRHSHMVVDDVGKTVNIIKNFIELFFDSISNKMIEINRESIFGGYSPNTWFHHCY